MQATESLLKQRSHRAQQFFASLLIVIVKSELGYAMTQAEAIGLAHHATLLDALDSIQARVAIHRQMDPKYRVPLGVQEAVILATSEGSDHAMMKILEVRSATQEAIRKHRGAAKHRERDADGLRQEKERIKMWGGSYSSFLKKMTLLYDRRRQDLRGLNLARPLLEQATSELDEIFAKALDEVS